MKNNETEPFEVLDEEEIVEKVEVNAEERKALNLYQKLVKIRQQVRYVKKKGHGYKFNYATGADIICAIRPMQDALNVVLHPELVAFEFVEIRRGNEIWSVPKITMSFTWIDADNPQDRFSTLETYYEDKMTGCQAVGSMKTYAMRYFLYNFFQVAVGEDDIEKIYKDNEWSAKPDEQKKLDARKQQPTKSLPIQQKSVEQEAIKPKGMPVSKTQIQEFTVFCGTLFNGKYTVDDVCGFIGRVVASVHDDSLEFHKKCERWKSNVPELISDFERSMSKFKKASENAASPVQNIA